MLSPRVMFRLCRILIDYRRRSEVVHAMPIRIWVESASRCNLRCPMCPNKDMPPSEKGLMELSVFRKVVDEARAFTNDIYLHHRGEPFLNPALFDMIAYARQAGIKTRFHTNGALLDEDKARRLLDAGPDLVSFSVDGFDAPSYERIRVGATFDRTVGNIVRLAELRRERVLRKPYIVVERIRFRDPEKGDDPQKAADLRKRFLAAGVDEVIQKEEYAWAEERAPENTGERTCSFCTFPWYAMVICASGIVTPCPQDFWAAMVMGDVKRSSLKEIWNGDAYRSLRRAFRTDLQSLPLCHKCDRLYRKTVGGVPFQYMVTFLVDQLIGYNRLRKLFGTAERN